MVIGEPYIRKKGDKLIIEVKADAKTVFIKTLPNVKTLIELLTGEASQDYIENKVKESSKASQDLERLEEVDKEESAEDSNIRLMEITRTPEKDALEPSAEEIEQGKRAINNLMKDILGGKNGNE